MITQEKLKELLHYEPRTGIFTWIVSRRGIKKSSIAGCVDKINGYRQIIIEGKLYLAHRLAWFYMKGYWPEQIDHVRHIKTDNKWENLREVTHKENGKNQSKSKTNSSGVTGVSWNKQSGKWMAYITVNEIQKFLGYFTDKFEAICARKYAENKYGFHPNHGQPKQVSIKSNT